ncbi:unnamed protein product [Prorocentrum cordatum]|uniref:Calmodulin n=1 Tax=Prorocentrum cordatum TaxID=2364126 RepID=A0ABN9RRN3_9DINO|nr:unnamed protein product [Polarella glacialis]
MGCCLAASSGRGAIAPGSSEGQEEISTDADTPSELGTLPSRKSALGGGSWRPQEPVLLELLRDGSGTPSDVWMQASFETQLRRLLREHPYLGRGNSVQPHPLQYLFGRCREMSQARQFGRAQGSLRRLVSGVRDEEALATEAFRRFDADQAGELDPTKFRHMCAYLGWDASDEKILDLDGDGKVTPRDLVRFVGHMGGARQFFERRRQRVSTSRKDVDHAGIAVGAKVKAHFYVQEQKSTMWREATVCEVGVARQGHDTTGPSTFGCRLLFKFGPGDKWKVKQVVPIHWVLGQVDNPGVNTALRETGILQEHQSYWSMILPDTELLTMERLTACQRLALRNVRERAEQRHAEALDPMRARLKGLGYDEHTLGMVLDWVQDLAPMVVHVKLDDMGRFLETDDYRSQFETKTSNGALDDQNVTRQGWERSLFGGAYEKAKPFERCKYGALNVMNDYRGVKSAEQYGDSYLVLKDVRLRTTLTFTDSSGVNIEHLGLLDKYAHVLQRYSDGELKSLVKVATAAVTSQKNLGRSQGDAPLELISGTTHDCSKEWVTLGFPRLQQSSGRLYFEAHLTKGCVAAQVGLLSADYKAMPYVASASGVGDDKFGWSCDGLNSSLWHGGAERAWEAHWSSKKQVGGEMCLAEDVVVGVALDLAKRTILLCTNGKWDEAPAFTSEHISEGMKLYPAMSVKGEASFCFGDFKYPYRIPDVARYAELAYSCGHPVHRRFYNLLDLQRDPGARRGASEA